MSDEEWKKFKEWGGASRLRKQFGAKPDRYYEVFLPADRVFIKRKNEEKND